MKPHVSVVVCTQDRANSLQETLLSLEAAATPTVSAEVIVVDNASTDNTQGVLKTFAGRRLPVRPLFEPRSGKGHAINRALDNGALGEIVVILDDDMSVAASWFTDLTAACERWPQDDVFGGRIELEWPKVPIPDWARNQAIQTWAFSAGDWGPGDVRFTNGMWPSGNHFWFRSRILDGGRRLADIWNAEAAFVLDALEASGTGVVFAADVRATHRVQLGLVDPDTIRARAVRFGRSCAEIKFRPYRQCVQQAREFRAHPVAGRLFCLIGLARWGTTYLAARASASNTKNILAEIISLERQAYYRRVLQVTAGMPEYKLFRLTRTKASPSRPAPAGNSGPT